MPTGPSPAAGTPRRSGAAGRLVGAPLAGDRADTMFADAAQVKPCWCRSQRGASGERRLSPIGRAREVAAPCRAPSYTGLWGISRGLSTANGCPGPTAQRWSPQRLNSAQSGPSRCCLGSAAAGGALARAASAQGAWTQGSPSGLGTERTVVPPAEVLLSLALGTTNAAADMNQAQEPPRPPISGPVTCRALGVIQSWTDTQTRCAYPPRLLLNGR